MRIRLTICDYENEDYRKEIEAEINSMDWLVYKDGLEHCAFEEFAKALHSICNDIEAQNDLPYHWYVDGKIKEV